MLLIKNAKIYTMAEAVIENGSVLMDQGKIIEVGPDIKENDNMDVIDANGKCLFPGFIDRKSTRLNSSHRCL